MGFLKPKPIDRPHYCQRPIAYMLDEGTRWQCDECKTIYCIELLTDRNIPAFEWVKES